MANTELIYNFKSKNFLILGGSGLIGRKVTQKILKNNAKSVINLDIKKFKCSDSSYRFHKYDFSNVENYSHVIKNIFSKKKIDVMINTLYPKLESWSQSNFDDISIKNLSSHVSLNINSFFWTTKIIADLMKKNKQGSIVLMNSIYGLRAQDLSIYKNTEIRENMTYPIVKGALSNYVRQAASYYGKYNIRINSICSGGIMGMNSMTNKNLSSTFIKNYNKRCILNRMANVDEVANAILFLASNASSYITGVNLPLTAVGPQYNYSKMFNNQTIFLTGGTGSFGKNFINLTLKNTIQKE